MAHRRRRLIVNADDFGQSPGINTGIIRSFENGIVTSASLMVRFPAAELAAEYARANPVLSVGLHFDIGEWSFSGGEWIALYEVVSSEDQSAVARELRTQMEKFSDLLGRPPTHLDSHQHVHMKEPVKSLMVTTARRLDVPLRGLSDEVRYCGRFYGQSGEGYPLPDAISVPSALHLIEELDMGTTEMGCHPAASADIETMYSQERMVEMDTLCDPRLRNAVESGQIDLCSFHTHRRNGNEESK